MTTCTYSVFKSGADFVFDEDFSVPVSGWGIYVPRIREFVQDI